MSPEVDYRGKFAPQPGQGAVDRLDIIEPEVKIDKIPAEVLEDFVRGVYVIHDLITVKEKPDAIIAPLRGAQPIVWVLEVISEIEGSRLPVIAEIPLGTNTDIGDVEWSSQRGIKGQEKIDSINRHIDTLMEVLAKKKAKIMLLDEAQTGGTISQHSTHINVRLRTDYPGSELVNVAAHNSLFHVAPNLDHGYERMLYNDQRGNTHKIALAMPHIDDPEILPLIIRQDPEIRDQQHAPSELLEKIENTRAKKAFQDRARSIIQGLKKT